MADIFHQIDMKYQGGVWVCQARDRNPLRLESKYNTMKRANPTRKLRMVTIENSTTKKIVRSD